MPKQALVLLVLVLVGRDIVAEDTVRLTLSEPFRETYVTCAPDQPTVVPLRWARGRFVTTEGSGSKAPNLCLATVDGVIKRIPLEIPGVAAIGPYDAVVSPTGDIYVSAAAFDAESRVATLLAKVSEREQTIQVCRVFPHFPARLAVAADGTLWTAGWNTDWEQTRTVDRFVLNRFDADCNLIQTIRPALRPAARPDSSELRASDDGVLLRTRTNEFVEYSLEGKEIGRYDGPPLSKVHHFPGVTFAVSSSGIVALGADDPDGPIVWVLDRARGAWEEAKVPNELPHGSRLLGFDGENLVVGIKESAGQTRSQRLVVASPSSDGLGYLRRAREARQ
jgi:hypothetical protein